MTSMDTEDWDSDIDERFYQCASCYDKRKRSSMKSCTECRKKYCNTCVRKIKSWGTYTGIHLHSMMFWSKITSFRCNTCRRKKGFVANVILSIIVLAVLIGGVYWIRMMRA